MGNITQSRHDAVVQALRATRDSGPANTDQAYEKLATELLKCMPGFQTGVGAPVEPIPVVSQAGDFYYDTQNKQLYVFDGTIWVVNA